MYCDYFGFSDGEKKNENEEPAVRRFNSNPTNCDEIGKLGYTLNGFYMVNGSDSDERFAIVICHFLLPPKGANKKTSMESQIILDVVSFY